MVPDTNFRKEKKFLTFKLLKKIDFLFLKFESSKINLRANRTHLRALSWIDKEKEVLIYPTPGGCGANCSSGIPFVKCSIPTVFIYFLKFQFLKKLKFQILS